MESQAATKDSFRLLLLASAITLVLLFIPYAGVLTYPIRLFVTFIHETGHALAALVTGGGVYSITLDWNENGLTLARPGWLFLFYTAGYLSAFAYGSGLLLLLRSARYARTAAIATGVGMLAITVAFGGNLLVWLFGLLFGAGLIVAGAKMKLSVLHFLMSFVAVQSLLGAVYQLRILLSLSALGPSVPNDASFLSEATGGWIPPMAWALGWSAASAAMVAGTLVVYYKSLRKPSTEIATIPAFKAQDPAAYRAHGGS